MRGYVATATQFLKKVINKNMNKNGNDYNQK